MKLYMTLPISSMMAGCMAFGSSDDERNYYNYMNTAISYIDYSEATHANELSEFLNVDALEIAWCAAFVNSVLEEADIPSLNTPGASNCLYCTTSDPHPYPLAARSFLHWGMPVNNGPQYGDLVIFPRGYNTFHGHVGFYMDSVYEDGVHYYRILGGNQNKKVSIRNYRSSAALGIRRAIR